MHIEKKSVITIGMKGVGVRNRVELVENPSEEKFFEHFTNCAIFPRPLSRDHFCENSASLLFHSSARERLQLFIVPTVGLFETHIYKTRKRLQYQKTEQFKGLSKECKQSLTVDHMTDIGLQHEERLLQNFSKLKREKHCPVKKVCL